MSIDVNAPMNEGESVDLLQHLNDIDLTTVDRSRPLIKNGTVATFVIEKMEVRDAKKEGNHNLNIELRMVTPEVPAEGDDGKTINAGYKVFDLVSLAKTDKYNPAEKLADIQLAVFGEQRKGFKIEEYLNQEVTLTIKVEQSGDYPAQNRVSRWRKKQATGGLA